ncbi:hypothetical protein [Gluconacetobacter takamatsuzukensis]|uniref:hypothetical protein n=1 Tax=Gluconacetobacter takamatsuzukensis TaxID=1286190 RepID=UPI0016020327|nr:hypothetical protein [Gluconacetobacter takamatsuzukensis]
MDAKTALRPAERTMRLALLSSAGLVLAAGWSVMAPGAHAAPRHRTAASAPATGSLDAPVAASLDTQDARHDPTVDPDNPPAPPPPDGYQVVQDEDVTAQTFSPQVTALHGPGLPSIEARQTPRDSSDVPSHFSVFDVPVKFNAPVQPAYNAAFTYSTYGGQPGRGIEAIGAEGAAGEP